MSYDISHGIRTTDVSEVSTQVLNLLSLVCYLFCCLLLWRRVNLSFVQLIVHCCHNTLTMSIIQWTSPHLKE